MRKVIILGGGVGGLTAAHELLERGFDVVLYEKSVNFGGKARSFIVRGENGTPNLPGEHGFHVLPGFYKHLPDTMKRIPIQGESRFVYDNLVETKRSLVSTLGKPPLEVPTSAALQTFDDLQRALKTIIETNQLDIPPSDYLFLLSRLLTILTACDERRYEQFENESWWEFIDAANRTTDYQHYFAIGPTRTLVACQAETISARTGGVIGTQLGLNPFNQSTPPVRVLNGPTNDVWFRHWIDYLESFDGRRTSNTFTIEYDSRGLGFDFDPNINQITGVWIQGPLITVRETGDYYVSALPVEVMAQYVLPNSKGLEKAEPTFQTLRRLKMGRMTGIQFFLKEDVPLVPGGVILLDSLWAITAISQRQFWNSDFSKTYGDKTTPVGGVLSVIASDWYSPCDHVDHAPGWIASECSEDQIASEVWRQLKDHLNRGARPVLDDLNRVDWLVDPAVRYPSLAASAPPPRHPGLRSPRLGKRAPRILINPTQANTDEQPLLVNTKGSWRYRPTANTKIENLFLAADYVRTNTDIASMECANEAARRAVNAILDQDGSRYASCEIWPLEEPPIFKPFRDLDAAAFKRGYDPIGGALTRAAASGSQVDFLRAVGSLGSLLPTFLRR